MPILIIALALFLRLYNYSDRVFLYADSARDVQVAQFAADHLKFPFIGQFSSAGPFFYGPWWYWFLELISFLPLGYLTQWYFMTLLSLVFIAVIYYLGRSIGGRPLGILAALLAAISPAQIENSFTPWNPTVIPLLSALALLLLVQYSSHRRLRYFFLLSFIVSLSLTIHFQSILILPILPVALFLIQPAFKNYLYHALAAVAGLLLPLLPLIYFDLRFNGYNSRSLWIYLTIDQFNIWVPNRWLTYAFQYWPEAWGRIIGGPYWLGGLVIALLGCLFVFRLKQFKSYRPFYLLSLTFILEVILYRYYRGERFVYYSFFAHPAVIILTAWVIRQLFNLKPVLGLVLGAAIFLFGSQAALALLPDRQINLTHLKSLKQDIYDHFPGESFDLHACGGRGPSITHPLALFMYRDGRNSLDGTKLEICITDGKPAWRTFSNKELAQIRVDRFKDNLTTEKVFRETVEWWQDSPPK